MYGYEIFLPCFPGRHLQPVWRVLPLASGSVRQCKPHQLQYLRERGLLESDGYFLADAPCRHLRVDTTDTGGARTWKCTIYETRPATCRDFCGKVLSGGKRFYVPEKCTLAGNRH